MENANCAGVNIFKTKREAVDHAASQVADFWLISANRILLRGDNPTPFTRPDDMGCPYGRQLSRDEIDREIYNRFRYCIDLHSVFSQAKELILERLRRGEFPLVKSHFSGGCKNFNPL